MTTDRSAGIICDQRITLDGFYISQNYPEQLRRIRFKDPESGKTLVFLTNNTAFNRTLLIKELKQLAEYKARNIKAVIPFNSHSPTGLYTKSRRDPGKNA